MVAVTALGVYDNVEQAFDDISKLDDIRVSEPKAENALEYERYRAQMNRIYRRLWGEKQKDGKFEFYI